VAAGGIPDAGRERTAWLKQLRAERLCDSSRAMVDAVETACALLDVADRPDDKLKALKLVGELVARAIAADKHSEALEIAELRKRADRQRELAEHAGGLH
jgi:hypothetical protein